jgi:Mce-associated membrane protein
MPIGPSYRPIAEPESTAVPAMAEEEVTESPSAVPGPRPRWLRVLPVAFGAATVVLGALGAWAAVEAHDLRANAASANGALVDASATRAVTREVTSAVNTIFSYSYADTARTKAAAQRLLTGPAIRQYNQLFALVQEQAPKEKLVVTTRVTNVGVELLTGGRSRLLMFANQEDSEAGTSQASYGGAMFAVTAVNARGRWLIESIDTFTGSA